MLPLSLLRGVQRLPFNLRNARAAARFGVKSWLTSISGTANVRIDQVLMAGLVSSRELGLYAVAVSIASLTSGLIMAVSYALYPRVARGDGDLTTRSCRVTIAIVLASGLALASSATWAIPFVFGEEFRGAVTMVLILLISSVPLSAAAILASGLTAAGDPAAPMRAELAAVVVTIPALIAFLPSYGGVGAAVISLAAYGVRFGMLLRSASRRFERSVMSFVLPTPADARWLVRELRRFLRRDGSAR
jgi:O-antigen/teichoic acid export membrane protein